jgi:hypothetical protein
MEAMHNGNRYLSGPVGPLLIEHNQFPGTTLRKAVYRDPVSEFDEEYQGRWLAETADVDFEARGTDWVVIVQESYETAIGATMRDLRAGLIDYGWRALAMVAVVVLGLWGVAYRLLEQGGTPRSGTLLSTDSETPPTSTMPRSAQGESR